jgi:hypothetical protein
MKRLQLSLGLVLAVTAVASTANVLVVRAAGPSAKNYPPGKMLPDSAKVALQSGDSLTLLRATNAQTLRGPGTFAVGSSGGETLALAAGRRSRFAALRSGEIPQNPSPWNLDITQSGKMCIADPAKLMLWRPEADDPAKLTISGGGQSGTVDFAAGKATAAWPAAVKLADGTEYRLQQDGAPDSSTMTFVTVKAAPSQLQSAAQVLIENGCDNQLDTLLAKISD